MERKYGDEWAHEVSNMEEGREDLGNGLFRQTSMCENGSYLVEYVRAEDWRYHRDDGPAVIRKLKDGFVEVEWYQDGKLSRPGGKPAMVGQNMLAWYVDGRFHHDGGPSLIDNQDTEWYHLNGVRMPNHIAMATDADFKSDWFFETDNVEVKREIIRKFGADRIFKMVNKTRDQLNVGEARELDREGKGSEYEYLLLESRLTDSVYGTYLKMRNPSIGVWHIEGVHPDCTTVQEAIEWRNGGLKGRPEILT